MWTKRWSPLLFFVWLTGGLPVATLAEKPPAAIDLAALLERALEQARKEDELEAGFKRTYYFTRTRVTEFKNSKGVVKKHVEKVSNNDPFRRRSHETEPGATARPPRSGDREPTEAETNVKGRAFEKTDFPLDGELLKRFDITYVRQESLNGRPAYVLDFKPVQPAVPDRDLKDKFINKAAGRVWVDAEDAAIAKADLYLTKRVNVAGGLVGAVWKFTCTMERERTPEGYWYIRRSQWHLEGREVLVQRVVDSREERTELRRLPAETPRVDAVPESH